jgi:hypothetical protein
MLSLWDSISAWFWDVPSIWAGVWRTMVFTVAASILGALLDGPAWIDVASLMVSQFWFNMRYAAIVRERRRRGL